MNRVRSSVRGATFPWGALVARAMLVCALGLAAGMPARALQPQPVPVDMPQGATQLGDGLTLVTRKATASPTATIELWVKCPASGYESPGRPGLARLTALSVVEQRQGGSSLRELVRKDGGQIAISVYQESSEIAILAPAYLTSGLLDQLMDRALRPRVDEKAFEAARQRLAAQQVAQMDMPDQVLRDSLFARLFAGGPLHDSSYGDPKTLTALTAADVAAFAAKAYVPAGEIVVAVGDVDDGAVAKRVAAAAPPSVAQQAMPESPVAPFNDTPVALPRGSLSAGGVALGWVGPPIADRRAATAMDFWSDYLTNPSDGVLSKIVNGAGASFTFSGQFVTLRNPGVFYVTAYGDTLDPTIVSGLIRDGMRTALRSTLGGAEFERARAAYVSHLLRDMQTSQGLADNYGWYFAQGALGYSPSSTGTTLSGEYFETVATLTPEYVQSVARRYLQATPAVVVVPRQALHLSWAP